MQRKWPIKHFRRHRVHLCISVFPLLELSRAPKLGVDIITSPLMPTILRLASLVSVALGAVGSLAFMFHVGRHNPSAILLILFTLWVVAPFAAMVSVPGLFKKWSIGGRAWFHFFTILVALGSSGIYADVAFGAPRPQPAFMFLVVPFVSLFVIAAASLISSVVSRSPR